MAVLFLKIVATLTMSILAIARLVFNVEIPDNVFLYGGFGLLVLFVTTDDMPFPKQNKDSNNLN